MIDLSNVIRESRNELSRIESKRRALDNAMDELQQVSESYREDGSFLMGEDPADVVACTSRIKRLDGELQQLCVAANVPNDYRNMFSVDYAA